MVVTISSPPSTIECLQSMNSFCGGSERYTAMNCIVLFLNQVLCGQSLQSNLVYNFTHMHAMSYRSDFFTCSSRVNNQAPAVCFAVLLLSAVFQVGLPSCLFPNMMLDSPCLNTSLLDVVMCSKDERVLIRDLGDLIIQILLDAWWASMNVDSNRPIAWNKSRHTSSWQFYLHCRVEDTRSPGIVCSVCHQVLRHPSEHETSSMGNTCWQKLTSQS